MSAARILVKGLNDKMKVIDALLQVYRVDGQLRGLRGRLEGAERFVREQQKQIGDIDLKRESLEGQLRQLDAKTADLSGESDRLEARINELRDRMNSAQTNREYKALLTEVNTLKADKSAIDDEALEHMTRAESIREQLNDLSGKRGEHQKVQGVAEAEREQRLSEIKDRLGELEQERDRLVAEVPPDVLRIYEDLTSRHGEDAMAAIEELDRRKHEYTCGSCMMSIPVEAVATLVQGDTLVRCVSCGCILYLGSEASEAIQAQMAKQR